MLYLNKLLDCIAKDSKIFKTPKINFILGLTNTQIKDLKKKALEEELIELIKQEYFLTQKGKDYLNENPIKSWSNKEYLIRPEVNFEYLKEEKTPPALTKAIRNLAKHLLSGENLKEFSLEHLLLEDIKKSQSLIEKLEIEILSGKRKNLLKIYEKFLAKGLTKSLISSIILYILANNVEKVAIYEKSQFQLKFDTLMFDRMVACPQNFELQKTEMADTYILKDVSKIILNKKSDNILEITKGLYKIIKNLDKYTMNTQNLSKKTLRLRNVIVNAKDPISLFERDIPKVLSGKCLQDCDREFINNLKISLNELKNCIVNLVEKIQLFIFDSFKTKSKEELKERFLMIQEYINDKELKILLNSVVDVEVSNDLWTNRVATFINKYRVPKDWSDEDFADFKLKTKELALKFAILESTVGANDSFVSPNFNLVLNEFLDLSKSEQMIFLRKIVNQEG